MQQRFDPAVPIETITEHPDNPRKGDEDAILDSIQQHGFFGAVLVQESSRQIIVGNHRTRMARKDGADTLPVLFLDVDDDTARRIMLAENRTNDQAGYHADTLAALLEQLAATERGLAGTGFNDGDLHDLVQSLNPPSGDDLDDEYDDFDPTGLWPVLRFKVSPESRDRYLRLTKGREGSDADLFDYLLDRAEGKA